MLQLQNGVQHMNRMKLVELMGPSGVGKTSVLKHAVLKHVYEWIPVNEIPFEWFFEDKKSFNIAVRQYIDEEIPDFLNVTYEIIFRSTMQPSQKLKTIKMLEETVERAVLSKYAVKKVIQ